MLGNLTKAKIIGSSFIAVVILTLAGGFAYLKFIDSKLINNLAPGILKDAVEGEPVNILLLGSDSRGEKRARSDTIIVLRYDPEKEKAYMLSIPRDSRVYIEGYGYRKINAANAFGGPSLAVKTVKKLTKMDIHHYVEIDFEGFKDLVDDLGGIRINVKNPIENNSRRYRMHFSKGWHNMNGTQALNYVRFRHDARGDFGRIQRQQEFFKALSSKLLSVGGITRAPYLVSSFAKNVSTDMGSGQLLGYAKSIKAVEDKDMMMTMAPGKPSYINGASYVILDEEELAKLVKDIMAGKRIKAVKSPF